MNTGILIIVPIFEGPQGALQSARHFIYVIASKPQKKKNPQVITTTHFTDEETEVQRENE